LGRLLREKANPSAVVDVYVSEEYLLDVSWVYLHFSHGVEEVVDCWGGTAVDDGELPSANDVGPAVSLKPEVAEIDTMYPMTELFRAHLNLPAVEQSPTSSG